MQLNYRNRRKFFLKVKIGEIYSFDNWYYTFNDVKRHASNYNIVIEPVESQSNSFKIIENPLEESRKPVMFDPEMLDLNGGLA